MKKTVPALCAQYGILPQNEEALLTELNARCGKRVHGRGKQKSQVQRDIENLESLLARKVKYACYQETFRGRNSFSKTDKDATLRFSKIAPVHNYTKNF